MESIVSIKKNLESAARESTEQSVIDKIYHSIDMLDSLEEHDPLPEDYEFECVRKNYFLSDVHE